MKYLPFVIVIIICTNLNAQTDSLLPAKSFIMDAGKASALLRQCSRGTPAQVRGHWQLAKADVAALEENFPKLCAVMGPGVKYLNSFDFQYGGLIIKGKKYIYINAFHKGTEKEYAEMKIDLSKDAVVVCDGGRGFWGVLYDVETKTFSELSFNGPA